MIGSATVRTCLVVCFTSAITVITLLVLIRPGHDNIITSFVDDVRMGSCASALAVGSSQTEVKDCTTPKPSQKLSPVKFVKDPWKYPAYGNGSVMPQKSDWWDSLLTPNGGFLIVEEKNREIAKYGVSMFHQLHCLSMIRSMLLGGEMHMGHIRDESHGVKESESAEDRDHWLHCFDYLIQGILCSADDSLEKSIKVLGPGSKEEDVINGMGHEHQCRNATLLYDYVLQSEPVPVKAAAVGDDSVFP
ncbi:hypothetical protein F5B20DRAFT_579419 [Whalleya microplaca]|nr:hypothetical protein F5B20DRAFT_579419 [Whalleya microplaca]